MCFVSLNTHICNIKNMASRGQHFRVEIKRPIPGSLCPRVTRIPLEFKAVRAWTDPATITPQPINV